MKIGDQGFLEVQIDDENGKILDINSVLKVQFIIDELVKVYDKENKDVLYDETKNCFKIWLTESETFSFDKVVNIDARILFKGEQDYRPIGGVLPETIDLVEVIKKEKVDV